MKNKLTADTITDEQIRELRMVAVQDEDIDLRETCTKALSDDMGLDPVFARDRWLAAQECRRTYRQLCADVINQRVAAMRNVVPHAIDEHGDCAVWCRACRAVRRCGRCGLPHAQPGRRDGERCGPCRVDEIDTSTRPTANDVARRLSVLASIRHCIPDFDAQFDALVAAARKALNEQMRIADDPERD